MQNPQLEAIYGYIRSRRDAGVKESEIRYELISHGHTDVDVTHYFEYSEAQRLKYTANPPNRSIPSTDEHRFKSTMFENPSQMSVMPHNGLQQSATIISPTATRQIRVDNIINPANSFLQTSRTLPQSGSYNTWRSRHSQKTLIFVTIIVLSTLIIGGSTYYINSSDSNDIKIVMIENFQLIEDPNYKIQIPSTWTKDIEYQPGDLTTFFYSPEFSSEDTRTQGAALTVSVYDTITHTEQIDSIRSYPTNKVLRDDSFTKEGTQYTLVEYSFPVEDGTSLHSSYIVAIREDRIIHASVTSNDQFWDQHAPNIDKILQSIIPIPKIIEKPAVSSSPIITPIALETVNSKVITNGLEVKLPEGWSSLQGEDRIDLYSESEGSAVLNLNDNDTSMLNSTNMLNNYVETYTETYENNGYTHIYSEGDTSSVDIDETRFSIAYLKATKGETVHTAIYITTPSLWANNRSIAIELLKSLRFE